MEEKNSIFRKKAMDKITSPEELDGYLKVSRPGVWFVLAAIIVLFIGVLSWAVLGRLETTVNIAVVSMNDTVLCLAPSEQKSEIVSSGKVTIAGKEYALEDSGYSEIMITEDNGADIISSGLVAVGDTVVPLKVKTELSSGVYVGTVVTEVVKPISFIIN